MVRSVATSMIVSIIEILSIAENCERSAIREWTHDFSKLVSAGSNICRELRFAVGADVVGSDLAEFIRLFETRTVPDSK